jgi:pimeloyl-ACP methyl ester carboxylesterase
MVLIAPAATFRPILPFYLHCIVPKFAAMIFPKAALFKRWTLDSVRWIRNGAPLDADWEELFRRYLLYGTGARRIFPRVFKPAELLQVKTPTLLLIGDKEVIYHPQKTIEAAQRYMPNLRAAILPNANHMAALSQPELVNEHILNFLH